MSYEYAVERALELKSENDRLHREALGLKQRLQEVEAVTDELAAVTLALLEASEGSSVKPGWPRAQAKNALRYYGQVMGRAGTPHG